MTRRSPIFFAFALLLGVALTWMVPALPAQEHSATGEPGAAHEAAPEGDHASAREHPPAGGEHSGGESHAPNPIYRWINFALLVGGVFYVLRRPLGQFFSARTMAIRESLEDGRTALAAAERRLQAVEAKLQGFETEMAAFRAAALKEMEEEHARLRQATQQEAEKMMDSVRVQMEVAGRQARLELRLYAAEQAIALGGKAIAARMDTERQRRLVNQFMEKLGA